MVLKSIKYGDLLIADNPHTQELRDEDDNLIDTYPAGMIVFWFSPRTCSEPKSKIIPDVFTKQFANGNELLNYIESNNLLDKE